MYVGSLTKRVCVAVYNPAPKARLHLLFPKAGRYGRTCLSGQLILAVTLLAGCDRIDFKTANPSASVDAIANVPAAAQTGLFVDVTSQLGLPATPPAYAPGTYAMPEQEGGGVSLFDYNNDGLLDILLVVHPQPGPEQFHQSALNRLYRQTSEGHFVEVPSAAGLQGSGYHLGAAVGDIDNDGYPDIYITNFGGPDQLFHNNGDGTFTDITAKAGMPTSPSPLNWSTGAAFFDYDGDGYLDLIVSHYATLTDMKPCFLEGDTSNMDYCGPHKYPGQNSVLYHNNRDGTFTDVTRKAGIDQAGHGLGVIAADLTGRGRADILQADDREPNQYWANQGDGTFKDEGLLRGVAFNGAGSVGANMGVAAGDIFNRGTLDLFITHMTNETNVVYQSNGDGTFSDWTASAGMAPIDRLMTGWGCGFFDFDNDGNLDVATANGQIARSPVRAGADVGPFWSKYADPNLLFQGDGEGHFTDVSAKAPGFTGRIEVHHGLAFGDLQNRGAIDMVEANVDNMLRVFRNNVAPVSGNHWLEVLPMIGKREALGARVALTAGGKTHLALCLRSYSYLASNDPRVHFGLGKLQKVDGLEIQWPSGEPKREIFEVREVDRDLVVRQGQGRPAQ